MDVASVDGAGASIRAAAAHGREEAAKTVKLNEMLTTTRDGYRRLEIEVQVTKAKSEAFESLLAQLREQLAQEKIRAAETKKMLEETYARELEDKREKIKVAADKDRQALERGFANFQAEMTTKLRLSHEQHEKNQALLEGLVAAQERSRSEAAEAVATAQALAQAAAENAAEQQREQDRQRLQQQAAAAAARQV